MIVKLWRGEMRTIEGYSDGINAMGFSLDGKLLASASNEVTIRL
jgi:hypothetical protein